MRPINLENVVKYVAQHIGEFHEAKLAALKKVDLKSLLKKKNPYLFKAKGLDLPQDLIESILDAVSSSSEEELFGQFLEDLAIFIAKETMGGRKSGIQGIDLEFENNKISYIVSIKSGPNWGNNAQQHKQHQDFDRAVRVKKQSTSVGEVIPVLGICYGKTRTNGGIRGAMKVVGQSFWYLISGNDSLYKDIIEPLGTNAKTNNELFLTERTKIIGLLTKNFSDEFCVDGLVDWSKVVELNSKNLDIKLVEGRCLISKIKPVERVAKEQVASASIAKKRE
jgi:hypothetical protein